MSNMHRLFWFDQQVRAMLYPNRNTMAEKFEISTRQAQRDIDYLKNSLGAPIKYNGKNRGYVYENTSYILPNVFINDIQRKMLKFLAYRYENYTKTPKVIEMAELFKRLSGDDEIDDDIPFFDIEKPAVQFYYTIYNAINSKNRLEITYKDEYKGKIEIKFEPCKLFYKYHADYAAGYLADCDNFKKEIGILRLDRILELKTVRDSFVQSPELDRKKYNSFIEKSPYVCRVKFNEDCSIKEDKGMQIKYLNDSIYEIEFFDIDDFINKLICTGKWEKIIYPKWLKSKIIKRCEEIIKKAGE